MLLNREKSIGPSKERRRNLRIQEAGEVFRASILRQGQVDVEVINVTILRRRQKATKYSWGKVTRT